MRAHAPTAAAAAALALLVSCGGGDKVTYRTEPVTRGPIAEVVSATGTVSALVTVNVGSQVSGSIARIHADFNQQVKEGQILAEIDPRLFEAALARADAALAAAEADVARAQAELAEKERAWRRTSELARKELVAEAEVERDLAAREGAVAAERAARARVLQARAEKQTASTNVALCRIRSPIDGVVISRSVEVGQTVAAAFQAPTLFTIANDLTRMQVLANIDEADMGKVAEGLEARFTVDAFPGETFHGRIAELRHAPTTVQNVVTYAAVIVADNPDRKLRQGMTAAVTLVSDRREDALRVPNAALRWKPPERGGPGGRPQGGGRGVARADDGDRGGRETTTAAGAQRGAADGTARRSDGGPAGAERRKAGAPEQQERATADPAGARRRSGREARVYRLEGETPVAVAVTVGISDGNHTEVLSGVAEGDQVIVADTGGSAQPTGRRRGFPF